MKDYYTNVRDVDLPFDVLAAILEGEKSNFRTVFYAHECATMRRIVEGHPGHDTMFYNVMRAAIAAGHYVEDVFGDQSGYYKHALIKATRFCDNIFAVGDYTMKEMRFLGADFSAVDMQLAYNGVPCWKISVDDKMRSRNKLRQYCKALLKYEPDYVFTHVTRLVPSKGLWRDLRVLEHVEEQLRQRNETAVLFTLSTEINRVRGALKTLDGEIQKRLLTLVKARRIVYLDDLFSVRYSRMLETMRERGAKVVDVKKEPEDAYAEHCRKADILTGPLRDCISYYNGEGNAAPGSLAYYGGGQRWHEPSQSRRWARSLITWGSPMCRPS